MNNIDDLAVMAEDKLTSLFLKTRSDIKRARRRNDKEAAADGELDLCYIQREIEIRHERKKAHARFMAAMPRKFNS